MANVEKKPACTICEKIGLKPFTKENIYYYYVPMHGLVSYGAQAINVMNPKLLSQVLPKKDLTNVFLLSTIAGSAFYLYDRPHLRKIPNNRRVVYSILGGTLFSMGSVLLWAVIKSVLKVNSTLATVVSLASGVAIVKLSTDYFDEVDKSAEKN